MAGSNGVNGTTAHETEESTERKRPNDKSNRQKATESKYTPNYEESPRKPSGDRPNSFNALAWLLEGATGMIEELRHNDLGLSEEFWIHAYAARHESLLALRAVVDDLIKKSESAQNQETEKQKRRERRGGIDINF